MFVVRPRDVQPIRVGESFADRDCPRRARRTRPAFLDALAADFRVFRSQARGVLRGAFEAKQFFDGRWNQRRIGAQFFQLVRMAQQRQARRCADQIGGGFLPADHGDDAIGDDFLLGQTVSIDLRIF